MSRTTSFSSFIHLSQPLPAGLSAADMYQNYSYPAVTQCPNGATCRANCSSGCTYYLTADQSAQDDLCGHVNLKGDSDVTCCKASCGQVEDMSNCGIIYGDTCNDHLPNCNVGGRAICTRSCKGRCAAGVTSVESYGNWIRYPTAFQQRYLSDNCKAGKLAMPAQAWQTCVYNSADFAIISSDDIDQLAQTATAPVDGNPNYDEIMTQWCSASVTDTDQTKCPHDPLTGKANTSCCRYFAQDDTGMKCRDWIDGMVSYRKQGYLDAMAAAYCSAYNTSECSCYSRALLPDYRNLKPAFPYNDGCWYQPCTVTYSGSYFQPSDVQTTYRSEPDGLGMCPSQVCVNYTQAGGNSTYTGDTLYITCGTNT